MNTVNLVKEFHKTFHRYVKELPDLHEIEIIKFRLRLLREEVDELEVAAMAGSPVEVLDALTDIQYVLDGTYLELGFYNLKEQAFLEVHRSNMSKLDSQGKPIFRPDGKILKGDNYQPPKLYTMIENLTKQQVTIIAKSCKQVGE